MAIAIFVTSTMLVSFFGLARWLAVDIDASHPVDRYRLRTWIAGQFEESLVPIAELSAAILLSQTGAEIDEIQPKASLIATFNVYDGFDTLRLLDALESAFGIRMPDREAETLCTFGELVDYLYLKTCDV
ncbi:MAG: hypothetical protein AAFX40_04045 [Cyanobacteria bacterium J06639_1]